MQKEEEEKQRRKMREEEMRRRLEGRGRKENNIEEAEASILVP